MFMNTMERSMTEEQQSAAGALTSSLTHLLHRACQVADSVFNEEAGKTGLTTRQFAVLVAVANNKDISQTGLVQVTGIDRSTVAEIVKRLLRRGLIKRKRTRLDARAYAVRLTDEGEALLTDAEPAAKRAEERLRSAFSGKDVPGLTDALMQLVEAYPSTK
ncbi:MAG: MarR family transcriptional regulator [Hyphomicrobiaceae bacterium]